MKTRENSKNVGAYYFQNPERNKNQSICGPRNVVKMGDHDIVWEFTRGHQAVRVISDDAMVHHYR